MTWALDLDGVVWLAGRGIGGSAAAVERLRAAGERAVFLTNNSGPTVAGHVKALEAVGIACKPEDLATSAQAAASMVSPGTRAAVVGDEGVVEALVERGAIVVRPGAQADVVVVGRTTALDYAELAAAASAVRAGARFIATNTDATFPTGGPPDGLRPDEGGRVPPGAGAGPVGGGGPPDVGGGPLVAGGLLPGAGALVAFVATAAGREPEVAGKPHPPMASLVRSRYGELTVVAGDRPDTDGRFAKLVGARFGLVLSGVTSRADLPVEPAPDAVADDLAQLVSAFLGGRWPQGHTFGPSEQGEGPHCLDPPAQKM
jgi:HAD superfamily hydrolase (TIGR01450 family)